MSEERQRYRLMNTAARSSAATLTRDKTRPDTARPDTKRPDTMPPERAAGDRLPPDTLPPGVGPAQKIRHPRPSRAGGLPKIYSSMETFLKRRGGRESTEYDYGTNNQDDMGLVAPFDQRRVRISHVSDTGDVYAINEYEQEMSQVALLAIMVEPDGTPMNDRKVNYLLSGWTDCTESRTVSWFVRKLQQATGCHQAIPN